LWQGEYGKEGGDPDAAGEYISLCLCFNSFFGGFFNRNSSHYKRACQVALES